MTACLNIQFEFYAFFVLYETSKKYIKKRFEIDKTKISFHLLSFLLIFDKKFKEIYN